MSFKYYSKNFILMFLLQIGNFCTAGYLIMFSYDATIIIPPLFFVCLGVVVSIFSAINSAIFSSKYFDFVPKKTFLLGFVLPITLLYIIGSTVAFVLIPEDNAPSILYSIKMLPIFFGIALLLIFLISSLSNLKTCKNCGKSGFFLTKIKAREIIEHIYVSGEPGQDVTVTDSDGKTYTGRIKGTEGATFEKRRITYHCTNCNEITSQSISKTINVDSVFDKLIHLRYFIGKFEYNEDKSKSAKS